MHLRGERGDVCRVVCILPHRADFRLVAHALERRKGGVERGWLGVSIQPLDEDIAHSLGLDSNHGALVASVAQEGLVRIKRAEK